MISYKILVQGVVQGVGFRPFVYHLAKKYNIKGYILNSSNGVTIEIKANESSLKEFLYELKNNPPSLAKIDSIEIEKIPAIDAYNFKIIKSVDNSLKTALIPADIAMCSDCLKDFNNPKNRRYHYPFINCTNCGPRYSIIKDIPYDRANTTMTKFKMCNECKTEYVDINSRFYHAQPISCPKCGPKLELILADTKIDNINKIFKTIAKELKKGKILALKGLGGFHLICNAYNEKAISTLRNRKNRPRKPFALMVKDIKQANELCFISQYEKDELNSIYKAIVLLKAKKNLPLVAPNLRYLGIMLPYTPIHKLLFNYIDFPIVATSANISGEPIVTNLNDLKSKLNKIYDLILDYNRDIFRACDDSVKFLIKDKSFFIRNSRGYAPFYITLKNSNSKRVLALGANQKSTISIALDNKIITSPYIGDLNTISSITHYKNTINSFLKFYNFKPEIIVCDLHSNYESTKIAKELALKYNAKLFTVQHHHAHILAVMAENNLKENILGISFDGTGLGDDGKLWGGEFLKCNTKGFKRVAHFEYFKLIGGEKAIKEPRRVALSLLFELFGEETITLNNPAVKAFNKFELNSLYQLWQKSLNSPSSSSVGRIFDAVASLLGIVHKISYEGESGMLLEKFYESSIKENFEYKIENGIIDIKPMLKELILIKDKKEAVSRFFNTLVKIILDISNEYEKVILSGGVFQNRVLLKLLLEKRDFILPKNFSVNDESISIGQAYFGAKTK